MAAGSGNGSGGAGTGSGTAAVAGVGQPTGSGGVLWMVIWFILLLVVVIWVSTFTAWLYIIILPFTVCVPHLAVSILCVCIYS